MKTVQLQIRPDATADDKLNLEMYFTQSLTEQEARWMCSLR